MARMAGARESSFKFPHLWITREAIALSRFCIVYEMTLLAKEKCGTNSRQERGTVTIALRGSLVGLYHNTFLNTVQRGSPFRSYDRSSNDGSKSNKRLQ